MTNNFVSQDRDDLSASSSLLAGVKRDEPISWERLVHLYTPAVKYWCLRSRVDEHEAIDICQEVFMAARRGINSFQRDAAGQSFGAWLRRITINKVIDLQRRQVPQALGGSDAQQMFGAIAEELGSSLMQEDDATQILYQRAIDLIAAEYSQRDNEAFRRVVVEEEAVEDVARDLGVSTNVVYLAKSRLLRRLREEFSELLEP
jgi:RNA polymerase sigma-70 factor (ECF subfamily)